VATRGLEINMQAAVKNEDFVGNRYRIGMLVSLASIAMLFTSLSSAYIVRSGVTYDWYPMAAPRVMFGSTALLLLCSVSIEIARRKLKQGFAASYSKYLLLTGFLGLGFLVSQLIAWRQLAAQGIYISTHPHSSFFYVLTGAHGVHIAGGLLGLTFVWLRSGRLIEGKRQAAADAVAIYWHFMGALWIYLFLLLFLWR
jgi:cytochrome c oxidase subunit 3